MLIFTFLKSSDKYFGRFQCGKQATLHGTHALLVTAQGSAGCCQGGSCHASNASQRLFGMPETKLQRVYTKTRTRVSRV